MSQWLWLAAQWFNRPLTKAILYCLWYCPQGGVEIKTAEYLTLICRQKEDRQKNEHGM